MSVMAWKGSDTCVLRADNGKLDAEVSATTEHGTEDGADDMIDTAADKKSDSTGRPARPQPPVCVRLSCSTTDVSHVTSLTY